MVKKVNLKSRGVNQSDIPLAVVGLQQHGHLNLNLLVTAASVEVNRSENFSYQGNVWGKIPQNYTSANDQEMARFQPNFL